MAQSKKVEKHSVDGKAITTKFLSLVPHDFIKGLVIAAISPVFTIMGQSFSNGTFTLDWTSIWKVAVAAGFAYLAKNLFEPTQTVIVVKPPMKEDNNVEIIPVTNKPDANV